jgi:hypothetical protein
MIRSLLLTSFVALSLRAHAAEKLILCGMDEVFVLESPPMLPASSGLPSTGAKAEAPAGGAGKSGPVKVWSWRAADRPELPEGMRKAFATTDDVKVLENGNRWLITSSSGGCAMVEYPSGRILWHARVPNAHSIEAMPDGLAVVASSISKEGNKLVLFDLNRPGTPLSSVPLNSAHGVFWDKSRQRLWALGFDELRRYQLKVPTAGRRPNSPKAASALTEAEGKSGLEDQAGEPATPALELEASFRWGGQDGHDLQPVPGSEDLVISDEHGVWLFDRKTEAFRPHPALASRPEVKSVSIHPGTGRVAWTMAGGGEWWTSEIRFLNPESSMVLPEEKLYKVRWLPDPQPAAGEAVPDAAPSAADAGK